MNDQVVRIAGLILGILATLITGAIAIGIMVEKYKSKKKIGGLQIKDEEIDKETDEENIPSTLVDLVIDHYINDDAETLIYGDTLTQCCYYVTKNYMCPVFKPDGTICKIDELKPMLEEAYKCKIDVEENAKYRYFDDED